MQGYCPYCNLQLECPLETPGMNCPACVQRVIIRDGKFLTLEQAKNQSASVHGDSVLFSPLPISVDKEKASLPEAVKGMQKKTEKWNAVVPILFYAFFTLTGYMVILSSAMVVPRSLTYVGIALPGLIIYGGNRFLVHKTGKHYLKGWKKRSIYGLSAAISILVAIPYYVALNNLPAHHSTQADNQTTVSETTELSSPVSVESQKTEVQPAHADGSLGIEWNTFRTRFNEYLAKSETGFQMGDVTFQNDIFSYSFSERIVMNGRIVNQKLNNVLLVGQGDGTRSSAADILLVIASLVRAVNPQMPEEKVTALLHKIIETKPKKEFPEVLYSNTILGGKEYYLSLNPAVGVWFSIEKVQK